MKSPTLILALATILFSVFTTVLSVFTTVLSSVIPHDTASSPDNASPPSASFPHPLSLLYPRAGADEGEQDVHTMATTFCKRCSEAYVDCANSCKHTSQCEIICQGVHVDGKLCKKECGWGQ